MCSYDWPLRLGHAHARARGSAWVYNLRRGAVLCLLVWVTRSKRAGTAHREGLCRLTTSSSSQGREDPTEAEPPVSRGVADARARLLEYAPDHSLDEFFRKTLDEAEALSGSVMAFCDVMDPDQLHLILQNWSTRTRSEYCKADGKGKHYPIASAGVWAECVKVRAPVIHNDYRSMPDRKGLPEGHADLVRELVVPVMRQGLVRAVLAVGNKPTDYELTDMEAVSELADLAWDIAETKIAQQQLQSSLEEFRAIADHAYDWETWTAPDGTYRYVSPSCERITGHTPAEFMADPYLIVAIAHPADRERVSEHLRVSAGDRRGEDLEIEFRIVMPDGVVRWVNHVSTPVYGESGEWLGRRGSSRDVTEHKRTEERLAHERQLLDQVEAVAHVGSWRIGLGKRELSEEAARILGFGSAPVDGDILEAVRGVVHPDDRALFEGPGTRTLLADGIRATDFRIVRPDGAVRWISLQAVVETGEDAEPIAVNGILQDVTVRKNLEEIRERRLEQDANTDRLTGLLNLRGFGLVAELALAQAERTGHGVGLLFCDIDGLKNINDELGHLEGDRALRDTAGVLDSTLRSADAIARVGGDEFVVLAIGDEIENVAHLRTRLQSGFELFNERSDRPYRLRVSCGSASSEPGAPSGLEELRARADAEMYAEKLRHGRSGGALERTAT